MQAVDPCPACWLKELDSEIPLLTEARFNQLSRTNTAPEPEELDVLHQCLANDAERLSALRRISEQLDALCGRVKDEMAVVQERMDNYHLLYSPARRVPNDLWGLIFSIAADYDDLKSSSKISSLDIKLPPWTLSYVCSGWRTLALSMPALWSSVRLASSELTSYHPTHFPKYYRRPKVSLQLLFGLQLMRSAGHKLSLSLEVLDGDLPYIGDFYNSPLLWPIIVYAAVVEVLLVSSSSVLSKLLDAFPNFSFSAMRSLTILHSTSSHDLRSPHFQYSTYLEAVTADPQSVLHLDLPWSTIRTFTTSSVSRLETCTNILSKTNNIERAVISLEVQTGPYNGITIHADRLRYLELTERPEAPGSSLLDKLELPALQSLALTGSAYPASLQRALGPRLKTASVVSDTSDVSQLLPRLLSAPIIESITLRCPWPPILPTMEHFVVAPTLQTLKLHGVPSDLQDGVRYYFNHVHLRVDCEVN